MHFNKGEIFLLPRERERIFSVMCLFLSLNILTKNAGKFAEEFLIFSQKTRSTNEPQMLAACHCLAPKERNVKEEAKLPDVRRDTICTMKRKENVGWMKEVCGCTFSI